MEFNKMKYFMALCLALCACSMQVDNTDSNAGATVEAIQGDPNAIGIPPGCRIMYFTYDELHEHPIMLCEFRNFNAKNTPDPDPGIRIQKRVQEQR